MVGELNNPVDNETNVFVDIKFMLCMRKKCRSSLWVDIMEDVGSCWRLLNIQDRIWCLKPWPEASCLIYPHNPPCS